KFDLGDLHAATAAVDGREEQPIRPVNMSIGEENVILKKPSWESRDAAARNRKVSSPIKRSRKRIRSGVTLRGVICGSQSQSSDQRWTDVRGHRETGRHRAVGAVKVQ